MMICPWHKGDCQCVIVAEPHYSGDTGLWVNRGLNPPVTIRCVDQPAGNITAALEELERRFKHLMPAPVVAAPPGAVLGGTVYVTGEGIGAPAAPEPVAPGNGHDFTDPYCRNLAREIVCKHCGWSSHMAPPGGCEPDPRWREDMEYSVKHAMSMPSKMGVSVKYHRPFDTSPPAPMLSGLGAIGCRMVGKRK